MEKIEWKKIQTNHLEFVLKNVGISFANGIRRIMEAEVPTICIDVVDYKKNSGTMEEEFIAHRLGLIPWKKTKKEMKEISMIGQQCNCGETEHCEICSIKMSVDKTGISDHQFTILYSGDIIVENKNNNNDFLVPIYDNIPITKLGKYQRVAANMWAKKCIGRMHQKWSPVHTSVYNIRPIITLNHELLKTVSSEKKKKLEKNCHANVFRYDEKTNLFDIENADQCTYCGDCERKVLKWNMKDLIVIDEYQKRQKHDFYTQDFIFLVQSKGSLSCLNILFTSFDILQRKIKRLQNDFLQII